MKILVAGGAGYLGSVLSPMLAARGHEVTVADACWFGCHLPEGIPLIETDLFGMNEGQMAGFDRVVFLAGLSNDPMAEYSPARNFIENAALPAYLAFCAKKAGVRRFVYGSSCSIYGFTDDRTSTEDSPVWCPYPYGISKLQGERGVMQLAGDGFAPVALRQGTVNGHSPRMRFDLIVNTMFKCAVTEGRIVVNHPDIWRPLVDIRDTAEAFCLACEAEDGLTGVFNIAYGNFTVGNVAEMVAGELGRLAGARPRVEINRNTDLRNYKVDCSRAREQLGFNPQYDVAAITRSLHEHLAGYGDLSDEKYYNIRVFRRMHPETPTGGRV